jgi:hypothetical protein
VDCNNDGVSETQEPQTPTKPKLVTHVRLSGAAFGAFGQLRPLAAGRALVDRNLWFRLRPISHSLGPSASKLMHAPGLPLRVIVSLVLTFMAVAGLAHGFADPMRVEAPSDRELISIFQAHRPEFDRLREMVTEDMHAQLYFSEATIGQISPISRRMEYRKLLRVWSGLAVGVDYNEGVRFIFATRGSAVGPDWAKGIQYITRVSRLPGVRVATTDNAKILSEGVYLRELLPHWFIFLQKDD